MHKPVRSAVAAVALVFCSSATDAAIPEGSFDPSWAGAGRIAFAGDFSSPSVMSSLSSIAVRDDGTLLVGGAVEDSELYWWIGALTSAGQFVETFGLSDGTGRFTGCQAIDCSTTKPGELVGILPLAPTGDDAYVILSTTTFTDQLFAPRESLVGSNDFTVNNVAGFVEADGGIAQQADGKLVLAGQGEYNQTTKKNPVFGVVRTDLDGNLDTTFNNVTDDNGVQFSGGAIVSVSSADDVEITNSIFILPGGKILVTGAGYNGTAYLEAARFNQDGTLDTTFGSEGTVRLSWSQGLITNYGKSKLDRAGRIVMSGEGFTFAGSIDGMLVVRLEPNGTLDGTFGDAGFSFNSYVSQCTRTSAADVAVDTAGRILAVGTCHQSAHDVFVVARLRGDTGAVDTSFGFNGYGLGLFGDTDSSATAVTFDHGGQPLVGGETNTESGLARLTYDLIFTDNVESLPRGCLPPNCD
jgi:uncharacterized delta-60 repeat protein